MKKRSRIFDNVVQRAVDGEIIYLVGETGTERATLVPIPLSRADRPYLAG